MKLVDLKPRFYGAGGLVEGTPKREGLGITFICPCAACQSELAKHPDDDFGLRLGVSFANPIDGGPPLEAGKGWQRTGETFETLSLTPSIQVVGKCRWHGFIGSNGARPGEVMTV